MMMRGVHLFFHKEFTVTGTKESHSRTPAQRLIADPETAGHRVQGEPHQEVIARTDVEAPLFFRVRLGVQNPNVFDETETMHASELDRLLMLTIAMLGRIKVQPDLPVFASAIIGNTHHFPAIPAVNVRVHFLHLLQKNLFMSESQYTLYHET